MSKGQWGALLIFAFLTYKAAASPVAFSAALAAIGSWLTS